MPDQDRTPRRLLTGRVSSDKMDKTVVVAVDVVRRHRVYGRLMHHTRKFKAHDPQNRSQVGDVVEIRESRPLSREKRWVVAKILRGGHEEIPIVEPSSVAEKTP
ncbi:MAG: 30S ribosomal protein S17 [Chloroflexi bacterium]|nr:30S ribosomal protein S17 [Chloroflexota bacterium]